MNDFNLWFVTGLQHICNWRAYDHILFVATLCILFDLNEWKKLLALITAFTLGHSLTLVFSTFNFLKIPSAIIEILIPLTIIITCIHNMLFSKNSRAFNRRYYFLVLAFGLIHGMGFSYFLKSMLGSEENTIGPLFFFNIGLEVGQIIIVVFILLISLFLHKAVQLKKQTFIFVVSGITLCVALWMAIERTIILIAD